MNRKDKIKFQISMLDSFYNWLHQKNSGKKNKLKKKLIRNKIHNLIMQEKSIKAFQIKELNQIN